MSAAAPVAGRFSRVLRVPGRRAGSRWSISLVLGTAVVATHQALDLPLGTHRDVQLQ